MYNNNMYNNTVGWMCWAARCAWDGYRNDEWFPLNGSYYGTNQSISTNPITLAMESTEYQTWLAKISSSGLVVGPEASSSGSSGSEPASGSGKWLRIRIGIDFWYLDYGVVHHREYQQHLMPGVHFHDRWGCTAAKHLWHIAVTAMAVPTGCRQWLLPGGEPQRLECQQ